MDPPPPPQSQAPPPITATAPYPDSIDSSPRSRTADDDHLPPPSKLRLMCSYNGHIVPRPHDKSLCYVGGETRIVVVDRHTSLHSLTSRLSSTLLNNRPFTLKYQLPSEDLDSLISVTSDEDLENMIEEYDRTNAVKSRLRLFLFPLKPDSTQSNIGPIIENSVKSEDWFVDALNGATTGLLNRGLSDSASVDLLLGLEDNGNNGQTVVKKGGKQGQDVHSVPDSPMLENSSSFGSTNSTPSLANLPPIKVHVDDGSTGGGGGQKLVGIEDRFAQIGVGGGGQKQEDGFVLMSSPSPMPISIAVPGVPVGSQEFQNRVFSDDERSDHGYRAPPQPQTLTLQTQQKTSGGGDVLSPDSISSDNSLSNAIGRQKPAIYQDQVVQLVANPVDSKVNMSDPNLPVQIQHQLLDAGYILQQQVDQQHQEQTQQKQPQQQQQQQQQHYLQAGAHYLQHYPTGTLPVSAYYPVYAPVQPQHLTQQHHQLDQQYPVYYVAARQPQTAFNMPMQQSGIREAAASTTLSSRAPPSLNPAIVTNPAVYNQMTMPVTNPEMASMYKQGTAQFAQVAPGQHQQQYVGYSQVHHPQPVAPTSAGATTYAYKYAEPGHQVYYTQPLAPTMLPQYPTTTAAAGSALPDASAQLPTETIKQQVRSPQPI